MPPEDNPRHDQNRWVLRSAERNPVRAATSHRLAGLAPWTESYAEKHNVEDRRKEAAAAHSEINSALTSPKITRQMEPSQRFPNRGLTHEFHVKGGADLAIGHLTAAGKKKKREAGAAIFESNRIDRETEWEKRTLAGTTSHGYIVGAQIAETVAKAAEITSTIAGLASAGDAGITATAASVIAGAAQLGSGAAYGRASQLARNDANEIRAKYADGSRSITPEDNFRKELGDTTAEWAKTKELRRYQSAAADTIGAVTGGLQAGEGLVGDLSRAVGKEAAEVPGPAGKILDQSAGGAFNGENLASAGTTAAINYKSGEVLDTFAKNVGQRWDPRSTDKAKEETFQARADVLGHEFGRVEVNAVNTIRGFVKPPRLLGVVHEAVEAHQEKRENAAITIEARQRGIAGRRVAAGLREVHEKQQDDETLRLLNETGGKTRGARFNEWRSGELSTHTKLANSIHAGAAATDPEEKRRHHNEAKEHIRTWQAKARTGLRSHPAREHTMRSLASHLESR